MHPKNKIEKTYIAKIEGILTPSEFYHLKKGIVIEGREVIPTHLKSEKRMKKIPLKLWKSLLLKVEIIL